MEQEARGASALVIWTDCDREGENIGFEIINVCLAVNRRLNVFRARFSEITPGAINRAVNNLVDPDPRLSDAVLCRSELDLRIGAAFTRLQTLSLRLQIEQLRIRDPQNSVVSYGSCQFPTLGKSLLTRYRAIPHEIYLLLD